MKQYKILLADDNTSFVTAMKMRLEKMDYEVVTATDGYNSLAKARSEQPDLMLLDVNMPAGDGFTVKQRLDSLPNAAHTPVIYLTGDHSARLDDLAERLGAFAILHKPVRLSTLMQTISNALQRQAA